MNFQIPKCPKFLLFLIGSDTLIVEHNDLETVSGWTVSGEQGAEALCDDVQGFLESAIWIPLGVQNMSTQVTSITSSDEIVFEVGSIQVRVSKIPLAIFEAGNHTFNPEWVDLVSSLVAEVGYGAIRNC